MNYATSRFLFYFWCFAASSLLPFQLVHAQSSGSSVSPGSVATSTGVSPGVQRWTVSDPTFMAHVNGRTTIPDPTASSNGSITVRSSGNVLTRNGNIPVSVSRNIKYADLIKPWKAVARAVPFLSTGLAIYDLLNDLCIRYENKWQECTYENVTRPRDVYFLIAIGPAPHQLVPMASAEAVARSVFSQVNPPEFVITSITFPSSQLTHPDIGVYTHYQMAITYKYDVSSTTNRYYNLPVRYLCQGSPLSSGGSDRPYPCPTIQRNGWQDLPPDYDPGPALDDYPNRPGYNPSRPPKLFDDLPNIADNPGLSGVPGATPGVVPSDQGSPEVTGSTAPVTGPSTTQTTPTGTTVTNNTSNVTYQGDTTTVTNNTTVITINNAGDVINQETTSDNQPTECELNPSAVSCQDLGSPPDGQIPSSDQPFSITPISLPGGSCPAPLSASFAGKTHSISFTPLCDVLPQVRLVVLLLSGVIAAWIVAGGLKS